jgi:hypothetical protein
MKVLSGEEIDRLLEAINQDQKKRATVLGWIAARIRKMHIKHERRISDRHLMNTIPDEADLPGVWQIWFNAEIRIPIWANESGGIRAFRVYPNRLLLERKQAPFLEWSANYGYASSHPALGLSWARPQFRRGSKGAFGQMQEWGDFLATKLRSWPRRWDRTTQLGNLAPHLWRPPDPNSLFANSRPREINDT